MKPAALLLILALVGCDKVRSPVEPAPLPTPTPPAAYYDPCPIPGAQSAIDWATPDCATATKGETK